MKSFLKYCFTAINRILLLVLIFLAYETSIAQTISLNEIMASNATTIADEDGDYEDWIELYNFGSEPVPLAGFGLSDDFSNPFRWIFPDVTIMPGEFLLVWASGKNRTQPGFPLHTNFSISAAGEEVLITHPSGTRIDEIQSIAIPTDISCGRQPDGTGDWFFFDEPTPDSSNITQAFSEVLSPPAFSHPGGFYPESFELSLTHPDPDVTIVFTLDGSIPDINSLDSVIYIYKNSYPQNPGDSFGDTLYQSYRTFVYTDVFTLHDRSQNPDKLTQISSTRYANPDYFPATPVRKGNVVSARVFKEGAIPSTVAANTFFVFADGNPYHIPVVSIIIQENLLFDYYDGIYTAGVGFDTWRINNPDATGYPGPVCNYDRRGIEWEYPVNAEVFDHNRDTARLNQGLGLRIHGGWGRSDRLKNLRLYARSRYDFNNVIEYDFFRHPVTFSNNPEINMFKSLILRYSGAGGIGRSHIPDAVSNILMQPIYEGVTRVQPVVHYINGEFWGITSFRDRFDEHHFANNFNLDPDNIIILEGVFGQGYDYHVKAGGPVALSLYRDLYNFVLNIDMSDSLHYQELLNMFDVRSYVDFLFMRIYLSDSDWSGHKHFGFWKVREPSDLLFGDGKWRVYTWDFDRAGEMQRLHTNLLYDATTTWSETRTALLNNLLESPDFKNYFINRFADHINSTFIPARVEEVLQSEYELIQPYLAENVHRWNMNVAPGSRNQQYINYCQLRPPIQRQHIREHFDIESDIEVSLDVSDAGAGYIRINTITITPGTPGVPEESYPWTGIYFHNIPIEVEAIAHPGYAFSHWTGSENSDTKILGITPTENISLTAHFTPFEAPESELVYFWVFNNEMPNDTPLQNLDPSFSLTGNGLLEYHSALQGYPFEPGHPNWRKASMERRNAPTEINYRPEGNNGIAYDDANMRGLQVRQPFTGDAGENTMYFHLPTTAYENVIFRFAAKDEGAAESLIIDYSVEPGTPQWTSSGLTQEVFPLSAAYHLYEIDFSGIDDVDDNEDFIIRIRFDGSNMAADDGNRVTFNNFSLDGKLIEIVNLPPIVENPPGLQKMIEAGQPLIFDLNEAFSDPENDPMVFSVFTGTELMVETSLEDSHLTLTPLQRGGDQINILADDGYNPPVTTSFRVLIYPFAHNLSQSLFEFEEWDTNQPDFTYPENMLFLQSDVDDPDLEYPLLLPYFIPHDDYHGDDLGTIGFPYNNSRRTRINGLGTDGISFINTGRGRDLGAAVLAIDTRGLEDVTISWTGGTVQANSRTYAIRLQYRIGHEGSFASLTDSLGNVVEYYRNEQAGHEQDYGPVYLPAELNNQPYVQLRWKYYFTGQQLDPDSGQRDELRLDNIHLSSDALNIIEINTKSNHPLILEPNYPNPFSEATLIRFHLVESGYVNIAVYNHAGKKVAVLNDSWLATGKHEMIFDGSILPPGLYFLQILQNQNRAVRKMMIAR